MRGRCDRTQDRLEAFEAGELGRWRTRLVARHLDRCVACSEVAGGLDDDVAAGLAAIAAADADGSADAGPPDELLDALLARAREPDVRQRVAAPARGAVSGARPGLSVALGVVVLGLVALAAWAGWRAGRAVSDRRRS